MDQDVGFGLRQLVDIAERALSPGINDPTTAVQAIDHLHDIVRRLATRALPPRQRVGDDGTSVLSVPQPPVRRLPRVSPSTRSPTGDGTSPVSDAG